MTLAIRRLALLSLLLSLSCSKEPPQVKLNALSIDSPSPKVLSAQSFCTDTDQVFGTLNSSRIYWSSTKVLSAENKQVPVVGTIDIAGWLKIKNGSFNQALGDIFFDATTTDSFDKLRDERIIDKIFGLSQSLTFTLGSISTAASSFPAVPGDHIDITFKGSLAIAGLKVPLEVPAVLARHDKGFRLVQKGAFTLNARGGQPGLNILGLDIQIQNLMKLVDKVDMLDEVGIEFEIDFVDLCN